jgi:uncharacterized membrane protein
MTRDAFLARLREGLSGLSPSAIEDVVSDYAAHFADGEAAGRSDEAIAEALGDPARLAREIKAEAGLKRWEERPNASAAAGAVFAVLGLGALDLLIILPVLLAVGSVLFFLFIASIAIFFAGGWVFVAGLFGGPFWPVSHLARVFGGIGMMAGAVSGAALLTLVVIGLVNLLVRYGRLHYQLLQPSA